MIFSNRNKATNTERMHRNYTIEECLHHRKVHKGCRRYGEGIFNCRKKPQTYTLFDVQNNAYMIATDQTYTRNYRKWITDNYASCNTVATSWLTWTTRMVEYTSSAFEQSLLEETSAFLQEYLSLNIDEVLPEKPMPGYSVEDLNNAINTVRTIWFSLKDITGKEIQERHKAYLIRNKCEPSNSSTQSIFTSVEVTPNGNTYKVIDLFKVFSECILPQDGKKDEARWQKTSNFCKNYQNIGPLSKEEIEKELARIEVHKRSVPAGISSVFSIVHVCSEAEMTRYKVTEALSAPISEIKGNLYPFIKSISDLTVIAKNTPELNKVLEIVDFPQLMSLTNVYDNLDYMSHAISLFLQEKAEENSALLGEVKFLREREAYFLMSDEELEQEYNEDLNINLRLRTLF